MGNYNCRRKGFLEGWKIDCAYAMFQGMQDYDIIRKFWPLDPEWDEKKVHRHMQNYARKLQNLRKDPKFLEYYESIMTEWKVHNIGPALQVFTDQLDPATEPYLRNKAANDVLNHAKTIHQVLEKGQDANTITFRFEGMPEIGEPSQDEEDDEPLQDEEDDG